MNELPGPRQVSLARIAEFGVVPKRSLGQNFLIDDNILKLILQRLDPSPEDVVVEVGAGLGVLTRALAAVAAHVHAFEIDRSLEAPLRATIEDDPRVSLYFEDALRYPLEELRPPPTLCASNLPYSPAAPFLAEALVRLPRVRRYVVMVQKEVAQRIAAAPGSRTYGALSVWVQLHAEAGPVRPLSRAVFYPRPNVDSSLIVLERRTRDDLVQCAPGLIQRVLEAAFGQRRKTLVNSLSAGAGLTKERAAAALAAIGAPAGARAEQLAPELFVALARELEADLHGVGA